MTLVRAATSAGMPSSLPAKPESATPGAVPATYDKYMHTAEKEYGVPWYMLAAMSWQETSHGASQTAESIGNLAQLAADLRRSVADFKLPEI